jgi:hypothetical protein
MLALMARRPEAWHRRTQIERRARDLPVPKPRALP